MALSVKKVLQGPLTASPEGEGAVAFVIGEKVVGSIGLGELPQAMLVRLALHGIAQKVGDSYAGVGGETDPEKAAIDAITATLEQIRKGEWRVAATGGGPRVTQLAKALARAAGQTVEAAVAILVEKEDTLSEAEYKAFTASLRATPAIKKALADIRAEEAAAAAAKAGTVEGGTDTLAGLFAGATPAEA